MTMILLKFTKSLDKDIIQKRLHSVELNLLNCKEVKELPLQDAPTSTSTPLSFKWKKVTDSSSIQQQQLQHESSTVFDFREVTIELKNETPYEVFNKVAGFEDFL